MIPARPAIPHRVRLAIYERDGYRCRYCGGFRGGLVIDHIDAYIDGGGHHEKNLATACNPCNIEKKSWTPEEVKAHLRPSSGALPKGFSWKKAWGTASEHRTLRRAEETFDNWADMISDYVRTGNRPDDSEIRRLDSRYAETVQQLLIMGDQPLAPTLIHLVELLSTPKIRAAYRQMQRERKSTVP